jgi:hypothetical protein
VVGFSATPILAWTRRRGARSPADFRAARLAGERNGVIRKEIGMRNPAAWATRRAFGVLLCSVILCTPAGAQDCTGDCNADGAVTVDELLTGIGIALGQRSRDDCPAFDVDLNGAVSVNELVAAVGAAFSVCRLLPTPTRVPDPVLGGALGYLEQGDLRSANAELAQAFATYPDDPRANLYYALSRIATRFLDDPRIISRIPRAGQSIRGDSRNVCTLQFKKERYPDDAPRSGEMVAVLREVIEPEVRAALDQLAELPADVNIRFNLDDLPDCLCPPVRSQTIEIDRSDILAIRGSLQAFVAGLELLEAYDIDVDTRLARRRSDREVLEERPGLLTLLSAGRLASGREQLENALEMLSGAISMMIDETDDQSDDVLVILPEDADDARKIQRLFDRFRRSLRGEVTIPIDVITGEVVLMDIGLLGQERMNLDGLFSGQLQSVRGLLPELDAKGRLDSTRFPDPTFAGMTPDLTQDKINRFLSESDYDFGREARCRDRER